MIYLNGNKVEFTSFPNGETCVDLKFREHLKLRNLIKWKYENDSSLMELFFFKKAIENDKCQNDLIITYMPYSRMDRKGGNYLFTLKYVSNFINDLKFNHVYVIEPHSDVTLALLDNSKGIDLTKPLFRALLSNEDLDKPVCMFPDATAQKRYSKIYSEYEQAYGFKSRNFVTGEITGLNVVGNVEGKDVVIIDDLCSFGGTFLAAGNRLKELGAKNIYLITPHCEFNIHKGKLLTLAESPIDRVYTTNSIINEYTTGAYPLPTEQMVHKIMIADILDVTLDIAGNEEFIYEFISK